MFKSEVTLQDRNEFVTLLAEGYIIELKAKEDHRPLKDLRIQEGDIGRLLHLWDMDAPDYRSGWGWMFTVSWHGKTFEFNDFDLERGHMDNPFGVCGFEDMYELHRIIPQEFYDE
jgi:hypothetical protein